MDDETIRMHFSSIPAGERDIKEALSEVVGALKEKGADISYYEIVYPSGAERTV